MRYPPGFPKDLHPPVDQALAEAEFTFRTGSRDIPRDDYQALQGLALEFMTAVVGTFAEQACEAVRHGTWNGEELRRQVDEFEQRVAHYIRELLADPSATDIETPWWYEVREQFRQSDEWMEHLEERAQVARAQSTPIEIPVGLDTPKGRRRLVDAYIQRVFAATGVRITKKKIWQKAGYASPSQFQRWQRCDAQVSKTAHEKFVALLTGNLRADGLPPSDPSGFSRV